MRYFLKRFWWVLIILLPLLGYFVVNICNPAFRDNALGNLFATLVGIGLGVPVALAVSRHQQEEESRKAREKAEAELEAREKHEGEEREQTLKLIVRHLHDELNENKKCLERLQATFTPAKKSNVALWDWLLSNSESLVSDTYRALVGFDSDGRLWRDIDPSLHIAYPMMIEPLRRRIKEDRAKSAYLNYIGDQTSADSELEFVQQITQMALQRVIEAIAEVDRFRLQKGEIQSLPQYGQSE
jgi:hypothetical protein